MRQPWYFLLAKSLDGSIKNPGKSYVLSVERAAVPTFKIIHCVPLFPELHQQNRVSRKIIFVYNFFMFNKTGEIYDLFMKMFHQTAHTQKKSILVT